MGIVKKLLDLGVDVNQRGCEIYGHTALSNAAQQGHLRLMDYLVQRGAALDDGKSRHPLERAISWNHIDVVSRFLELGVDINAPYDGQAPVNSIESSEMLQLLVTNGALLNQPCLRRLGQTALQRAAFGELALFRELIKIGADVHAPGPDVGGRTALQSAAYYNNLPVVRALIDEYGADVNEPRSPFLGYTSLEAACHGYSILWAHGGIDLAVIELLLAPGARLTPFPLHLAAAWDRTELAKILLRHGAVVDQVSDIGIVQPVWGDERELGPTVVETALLNGFPDMAEMLRGWSISSEL